MIDIVYTLHTDDGGSDSAEISAPLVPRVGEMVDIEDRAYRVVDVLWHHYRSGAHGVSITACEDNWHKHIDEVLDDWRSNR
ncbi:hypothetical protein F9C11_17765 [Amycolatopsis sp. VS8301801F10]|uniref:hypothetical protein n=1 Tax=Amycolatopsis sp. VS8301801F10 TaxID=2652442 RepID=UPI0038FD20D5